MIGRAINIGLLAVAALVAYLLLSGGGDPYKLRLQLDNADGLIKGSPVTVSGVEVGHVANLDVDDRGKVVARLEVKADEGPLGKGATAEIRAANLLGSKHVILEPGDERRPLPSGALIAPADTQVSVDLQDIFDVLDADTRTRLAVLVNEAGTALTGRKTDFNTLLGRLPSTLGSARQLLEEVQRDNAALGQVVATTDTYLGRITPEREALGNLVRGFGETFETVAARRGELRETLARAPGTLRTLRGFLGDLEATTVPLGPASRAIQASALPLQDTLAAVPGFEQAAAPALDAASDAAPSLTELAKRATPVLRRTVPAATRLAGLSEDLGPATSALGLSIDDLLATVQGWSRAIQTRDGISHYFRADISVSPDLIQSAIDKGTPTRRKRTGGKRRLPAPATAAPPQPGEPQRPEGVLPDPGILGLKLPQLPKTKVPLVDETAGRTQAEIQSLLDYLLGP